jgi:hypothetical protein
MAETGLLASLSVEATDPVSVMLAGMVGLV